ncbi:Poly [ADP-ribose] polymerase [Heracleum sosnowskyi]|uniref:Poly [ADP-ribose] polymerase n=1 Tax=Heracleum sosnowskyi TaxID=360622 RepID=A0AAD8GX30_9APIA|nr:Poly [ADP-ribose] polymerase [Heracleum sosnowskyi]
MKSSTALNNCKSQVARKIVHPPRDSRSSSFHVQSLLQNYRNFKISGEVSRLMYYDGYNWVNYDEKVVEAVRDCWNCTVEVEIEGVLCLFDFYRMLVFDFVSHVEKSVAWIDVDGNCFSPKFVVDEFSGGSGGELLNKRKREEVNSFWNVVEKKSKVVCESMRWKQARVMGEECKSYLVVKKLFLNWGGIRGIGAEISGIYQVTWNSILGRARYDGFFNQVKITKAARGNANVTLAWIKCSSENVERFLNHGFSSPWKAEAHGCGIYLSPFKSNRVSVMPQDAGENYVILCRLILGKCEKIQAGSQQLYPSSAGFDTGVDDVSNPKWYVVWGANINTHILPECVVTYNHNVPAQSSAKPNLSWMPKVSNAMTENFFMKLQRSLPASKLSELQSLCSTYKRGKLPKGMFTKMLQSVVGDQMLRTTIQEVGGGILK